MRKLPVTRVAGLAGQRVLPAPGCPPPADDGQRHSGHVCGLTTRGRRSSQRLPREPQSQPRRAKRLVFSLGAAAADPVGRRQNVVAKALARVSRVPDRGTWDGGSVGVPGLVTPRLRDAAFVACGWGCGVGGLPLPNRLPALAFCQGNARPHVWLPSPAATED